jgi:type II secretory pathway component GspD/PulD (secretin)
MANAIRAADDLAPTAGVHSFHLHAGERQIVQQVFKAYGIEATVDDSVRSNPIRLDVDDASFETAMRLLSLTTESFYVALDAHRALVVRDTRENRLQFTREESETIYLSGLSEKELPEIGTLAKNVFDIQQATVDASAETITLRASRKTLETFNATLRELLQGHSQVLLKTRVIQLAHTNSRDTGIQPPQAIAAVNVYAAEQSILSANSALVQEIISEGLASANDIPAILGILLASGQVSSSLFSNGFALFGGGITQSAISPGSASANITLNSSDSRELDLVELRLGDGEEGSIRSGTRYPIQTSSYSSLDSSASSIAGLSTAGSSSSLSALLASYSGSTATIPQVQYEDLGLTLKATPKVLRSNDVALNIDMKIDALSGSSLDGNPILASRAYSGLVIVKEGEAVMIAGELSKTQSRALSGVPGVSEIPGLNNLTGNDTEQNYATLLIIMTPQVLRGTQAAGHTPQMRVERGQRAR